MSSKEIWYDWNGGNVWLFKLINNSFSGEYYDEAVKNVTMLGDKKLLPYFIAVLAAYALVSLIGRVVAKRGGSAYYAKMWVGIFLVMGAGLVVNYSTTNFLKEHFAYQRPYAALPSDEVRHLEFRKDEDANRGFPSGHVAIISVLVLALWPALGENFRWFGGAMIFGVAWSRIALGVHFPADVLASFLIAWLQVVILRYFIYGFLRRFFGVIC